MYECPLEFETVYLKTNPVPTPGTCSGTQGSTKEWGIVEKWCNKATLGWATGGDEVS
jgi:hypothetical protein